VPRHWTTCADDNADLVDVDQLARRQHASVWIDLIVLIGIFDVLAVDATRRIDLIDDALVMSAIVGPYGAPMLVRGSNPPIRTTS